MKYGLSEEIYSKIMDVVKKYDECLFKIFGSRARGDYKYNSDIDIAVYGTLSKDEQYKILDDFDLIDMAYTMDILFIQNITREELKKSIEREGIVLK